MTGRATHSLRPAAPRRLLASPGWFLLLAASVALLADAADRVVRLDQGRLR